MQMFYDVLIIYSSSFMSDYPTKRIQIVLKLVKHPREILLNFDLDPCAMGYDGSEVYMLPRAARALQSKCHLWTYPRHVCSSCHLSWL